MESLGSLTDKALKQKPTDCEKSSGKLAVRDNPTSRAELTTMLAACFQTLNTYGADPESIADRAKMFQLVLADYPLETVKDAMVRYLRTGKTLPTPADIVALVDPAQREPDRAVYVEISKKAPEVRTPDDWAYMRKYERWALEA